ncbi:MAG: DUF1579 family protein [Planctomycetota bacterium]|nr:DUF1579 family protein [Planctomycetota bacterium]
MKLSQFTFALAVILAFVLGQTFAVSEEEPDTPKAPDMEKVMKIITPGKWHKEMGWYIGTWDVAITMMGHMPDGKSRAMPATKAVSEFRWQIAGRWMVEEIKGQMPMMGPYHSFLIHGYDNFTKNFVSCGVSSMDTSMNMFRGVRVDPEDRIFTQYGTINEWLDGTFNKPVKVLVRKIDDNRFETEIWDLQIGANGKPVVIMKYTRRTKDGE